MTYSEVPAIVGQLLRRPTRWAPEGSKLAVYDGHERTLEVFNVESRAQLQCLERLEPHRPSLELATGGPLVILFFSTTQSLRHADFVKASGYPLDEGS